MGQAPGHRNWQFRQQKGVFGNRMEGLSSNRGVRLKFLSWSMALIAILLLRAVVSFAAKPDSALLSYGSVSYFLLLLLATGFAIRNGVQNTLGSRPFWVFLALGYSLWMLDQWIFLYYEFGLHTEVPDNSIADPVLFLHIVPLMAAVATLPHSARIRPQAISSDFELSSLTVFLGLSLCLHCLSLPVFVLQRHRYALRFDILYLIENLALVLAVGILSLRVQYPWKMICLHLLGASALYALSSAVANIAIDSGGYVNGKLYGLGLTASACWFVWIPLRAGQITRAEVKAARSDTSQGSRASAWSMLRSRDDLCSIGLGAVPER